MASEFKNVELTQLSRLERDAMHSFSARVVQQFGKQVSSLSVHGLNGRGGREAGVLEMLVLLKKPSMEVEGLIEELALDQYIETGVSLRVTCFDQKQFKTFQKMKLPRVAQLATDAVSVWAA